MALSQLFNEFIFFSFIGWIYECAYCTFKGHKWENRGFFFGPICPIYGVGSISCTLVFGHLVPYFTGVPTAEIPMWRIFWTCFFGSVILEYSTSYVLEKLFHARWWDYEDMPLNVNGRICLPASIGFGVAGVLITFYAFPLIHVIETRYYLPIVSQFFAMLFMGIFGADAALTVSALHGLLQKVEQAESEFNIRMEAAYASFEDKTEQMKESSIGIMAGKVMKGGSVLTGKMREGGSALAGKALAGGSMITGKVKSGGTILTEKARELTGRLTWGEKESLKSIRTFKFKEPHHVAGTVMQNENDRKTSFRLRTGRGRYEEKGHGSV